MLLLLSRFSHVRLCVTLQVQPTRLPRPWDSPGKNTGVDCHFLLQCMKVKSQNEVSKLCLTLSDPMDYSLPGSSIHGIFQARVLEWGAIAFSCKGLDSNYFLFCQFSCYTICISCLVYTHSGLLCLFLKHFVMFVSGDFIEVFCF